MGGGSSLPELRGGLKEKTQDTNFSLTIKNPNPLGIKKRIPDSDSKIGQKLGGFRIWIAIPI